MKSNRSSNERALKINDHKVKIMMMMMMMIPIWIIDFTSLTDTNEKNKEKRKPEESDNLMKKVHPVNAVEQLLLAIKRMKSNFKTQKRSTLEINLSN